MLGGVSLRSRLILPPGELLPDIFPPYLLYLPTLLYPLSHHIVPSRSPSIPSHPFHFGTHNHPTLSCIFIGMEREGRDKEKS